MVAADDDRCLEFALRHHLVEGEAKAMAIAQAHPADAGGQTLEVDLLPRHVEPVMEMGVVGQQFLHLGVGLVDILRIARQRRPAERADTPTEERADVGGDEAGEVEGIVDALVLRHLADIIAIVGRGHARRLEIQHGADMDGHAGLGSLGHRFGFAFAPLDPFGDTPAGG